METTADAIIAAYQKSLPLRNVNDDVCLIQTSPTPRYAKKYCEWSEN
jgi:hypothetical protein